MNRPPKSPAPSLLRNAGLLPLGRAGNYKPVGRAKIRTDVVSSLLSPLCGRLYLNILQQTEIVNSLLSPPPSWGKLTGCVPLRVPLEKQNPVSSSEAGF